MLNEKESYSFGKSDYQVGFPTAYDTNACKGHMVSIIIKAIREYHAMFGSYGSDSQLRPAMNFLKDLKVTGNVAKATETSKNLIGYSLLMLLPGTADIPFFSHPLVVENHEIDGAYQVVVDVRNFVRRAQDGSLIVTAFLDFNMALMRGALQVAWLREDPKFILNTGHYQMTVFSRWIATCLTSRFVLAEDVQMRLNVLSAYYYYSLFQDKRKRDDQDDMEYYRMLTMVGRATRVLPEEVQEILTGLPLVHDVHSFVEMIKRPEISGTSRLESLNPMLFLTTINGAWIGTNKAEILSVAFEHPPTFLAVLYAALTEAGVKKSRLSEIARIAEKSNDAINFTDNLKHIIALG